MTTTEHYQLSLWAEEDFVSLDQMNENFTKVDEALQNRKLASENTNAQLRQTMRNQAQALVGAAHGGMHYSSLENVMLSAFEDGTDLIAGSYVGLYFNNGMRKAPALSSTTGVWTDERPDKASNGTPATKGGTLKMGHVTVTGWCNASMRFQFTTMSTITHEKNYTARIYAIQNGHVIAQTDTLNLNTASHNVYMTINNIDPSVLVEIWIDSTAPTDALWNTNFYIYAPALTAITVTELTVETKTAAVSGEGAKVWWRYSGTAPAVGYKLGSGNYLPLTPAVSDSIGPQGTDCKLASCEIPFGEAVTGSHLQFQFALADDTVMMDYWAVIA